MKYNILLLLLITWIFSNAQETKLTPIPFNEVQLKDEFWLPCLKTKAKTLVPFALEETEWAVENLRKKGQFLEGNTTEMPFAHRFVSSDLYKVMEGAAYLLKAIRTVKEYVGTDFFGESKSSLFTNTLVISVLMNLMQQNCIKSTNNVPPARHG